jgi:uncharacterized protein
MLSKLFARCLPLCVLACSSIPSAHAESLSLCTARADGNYYAAGEEIRRHINGDKLQIALIETAGSVDNLNRLARGECDAAIVQLDAYLEYQEANRRKRLELARPSYLYDEFVHLVCRRDAGIGSIEDLAGDSTPAKLLIGEAASGSAATWKYFTRLKPRYQSVPTQPLGGMAALAEIQAPGGAACMIFVSGLRSKFSAAVDAAGSTLQLVPVDDLELDEARFAGERIYRFRPIPAGSYPALQNGAKGQAIETLSVGATLFVAQRWAADHYDENIDLGEAILKAKPAIVERVSPK